MFPVYLGSIKILDDFSFYFHEAFDLHRVILVNEKVIMWQHRTISSFDLIS